MNAVAALPRLCRNGLHPSSDRAPNGPGHWQCRPCRETRLRHRWQIAPGGFDGWTSPVVDAERHARWDAWVAGLADAIWVIRRDEGFTGADGWRTLGDVPGMQGRGG